MIALIASALLGLYIFVPYIVFHRLSSLFIRLKKFQRSKTDEIVFGVVVAGFPFLLTLLLFSHGLIGASVLPFAINESSLQRVGDYQTVLAAAYSDHYFENHQADSWKALSEVCQRQANFLLWNYILVLCETGVFVCLVGGYGKWKNWKPYALLANRVLLPAVSEWQVLLTDFNFPASEHRSVEVDALTKDDILYRGNIVDHFLGSEGELTGLLLGDAQRFQYDKLKDDRKSKSVSEKSNEQYWKRIAGGGNFYLPGDNIASLNIRYPQPKADYEAALKQMIQNLLQAPVNIEAIPSAEHSRHTPSADGSEVNEQKEETSE